MTKEFRSSKPEFCCERQKGARAFGALLIRVSFVIWHSSFVIAPCSTVLADDFAALCADRAAIEQVYYNHRIGTKAPFEETMPPALVEKLVREDLHKEMVLKKVYAVEITPALLESEVQRINTTTRAPDVLAELKAALGNDTNRFARTMAKPILVERVLRDKFDNGDALHAGVRRECELVRNALLAAKT